MKKVKLHIHHKWFQGEPVLDFKVRMRDAGIPFLGRRRTSDIIYMNSRTAIAEWDSEQNLGRILIRESDLALVHLLNTDCIISVVTWHQ